MPVVNTIQLRRDSLANWTSVNPTLAAGEVGYDSTSNKIKIGNGSTAWNSLEYASGGASILVSATAPVDPEVGDVWFNTETGISYVYYDSFWTSIAGSSGAPIISDTAPASPVLGMQWFNSSTGKSYLYYSGAWVEIDSASPPQIGAFANAAARTAAIPSPTEGMYTHLNDTDTLQYYNGSAWTNAIPAATPPGLNLIATSSFTTAAAANFNNVFTSTYENYRLLIQVQSSTQSNLLFRMRVGGADATGADYYNVAAHQRTNGTIITPTSGNPGAFATINILQGGTRQTGSYEISMPQLARPTDATFSAVSQDAGGFFITTGGFRHGLATAYDGFTIYPNTGTITGKVQLFGYRN